MGGRSVVTESPEVLEAVLGSLRRHGVSKYERDADGGIRVEFFHSAPHAVEAVREPPAVQVGPDEMVPPSRAGLSSIPPTDPLFDGVEGV